MSEGLFVSSAFAGVDSSGPVLYRYPTIIDSVIQSRAIGLVGVKGSTMSMMAERRVKDWNGGFAAEVRLS